MAVAEALASISALKSAIFSVQLSLLEGIPSDAHLQAAGRILTQSEYADVVTERSIAKLCGFPLCRRSLPDTPPRKGRYRISLPEHKVYDLQETRLFCCTDCLVASQSFAASLPPERDALADTRRAIELAAAFQNLSVGQGTPQEVPSDSDERKAKHEEDASSFFLIREQEKLRVDDFEAAGPSDAIEGYTPQREHRQTRSKQSGAESEQKSDVFREERTGEKREIKRKTSSRKAQSEARHRDTVSSEGALQSFTSSILLDGEPLRNVAQGATSVASQPQKVRNRVSWADHHDKKLAEEASFPSTPDANEYAGAPESSESVQVGIAQVVAFSCIDVKEKATNDSESGQRIQESVEWTDRLLSEGIEEQSNDIKNQRLEAAEALVAALTEAAQAVAYREVDPAEAVARAGISFLITTQEESRGSALSQHLRDSIDESGSASLLDDELEEIDPRECWYSAPPKDFKPELSTFGTIWMALDRWISAASIAYLYCRDAGEEDEFTSVNGKEYMRQMTSGDGVTAEIERTLAGCISRALPGLAEALRLPIPLSTLEQALGRFLRTMTLVEALPPFGSKQWCVVVVLLLEALSVQRLPLLRNQLLNSRIQLRKVLDSSNITEAEYDVFRDLILPMGRHPDFAAHCGG